MPGEQHKPRLRCDHDHARLRKAEPEQQGLWEGVVTSVTLLWSFKVQSQSSGGVIQEYLACGIYSLLSSSWVGDLLQGSRLSAVAALTFSGQSFTPPGDSS